ncbi:MAG TPA: glycosyltransferase family 39 protein [Terriglobia bacterium]|nr:glycosyltransferase family 39 protein [Terriglobia bacterium]
MVNSDRPSSRGWFHAAGSGRWLALALGLVLLMAIPNLSYPIGRDQATYCVIGRGLLDGARLYRDLWDNKPPGIFYLYAAIVKVFGPAMWSVGLLDILWLLAISVCIFRFTEPSLGKAAAFFAVLVNAALHIRAGYWDAGQPETFLMLFVFGSYFLLSGRGRGMKRREMLAGVLFAAAFWLKYNAAVFLPFLLLAPLLQAGEAGDTSLGGRLGIPSINWTSSVFRFAAGFLLGSFLVVSGCLFSGGWSGFIEEQFQVLPRYAATASAGVPDYWAWAAGRIEFWLGFWTLGAALAAVILAWRQHHLLRLAPALVGAAAGFAALAVQIRYQPYYFETCYPFFAIFSAYLIVQTYEGALTLARYFARRNWQVARVLTWVVFANLVGLCVPGPLMRMVTNYRAFNQWRQNPVKFYSNYSWPGAAEDFHDVLRVVDYLKRHPGTANGVYVWGNEPLIYYLSGYRPPVRFVWNLPLIASWRLPGWRRELVSQFSGTRPGYIIVARRDEVHDLSGTYQDSAQALRNFPGLNDYLRNFYQPCADDVTFEIYCRAPGAATAASTGPPS